MKIDMVNWLLANT